MTEINTFSKILNDNLAHIVHVPPGLQNNKKDGIVDLNQISKIVDVVDRKYNLVYAGVGLDQAYDPVYSRKERTDILVKVVADNPDKTFMIIDNDRLNWQVLEEFENCQVWKRKYYNDSYYYSIKKMQPGHMIEKEKTHWFCACMGRNNYFRTEWFHWCYDRGLLEKNKVSYLSSDQNRGNGAGIVIDPEAVRQIYMRTNGRKELAHLIPYNNYESSVPEEHNRMFKTRPIFDCLFNIVHEGFMTDGNTDISEKSLDTVVHGNVPVIISAPGTMNKFQGMGMIVPDYIDWHIWDDIPVDQMNYSKIEIIQRQLLELFSKHKISEIAEDWYPYAVRNLKNFQDLADRCLREEKEICRWILATTHNMNNPKYQSLY